MMRDVLSINDNFDSLIDLFSSYDIPLEYTYTFIYNNIEFLLKNKENICEKLYFILNKNDLYGVIYSNNDEYYWSIIHKNKFSKFESIDVDKNRSNDYIVDMIIDFSVSDKLLKIIPDIDSYNVEERLKTLKKIKLNSNGYHIK